MIKTTIFSIAVAGLMATTTGAMAHSTHRIEARLDRQANRIEQGRKIGDLTFREGRQLRREQRAIAEELRCAREDGVITGREVRQITHLQNHASQSIFAERHDNQRRRYLPRFGR